MVPRTKLNFLKISSVSLANRKEGRPQPSPRLKAMEKTKGSFLIIGTRVRAISFWTLPVLFMIAGMFPLRDKAGRKKAGRRMKDLPEKPENESSIRKFRVPGRYSLNS
jgi:hypothetical protein